MPVVNNIVVSRLGVVAPFKILNEPPNPLSHNII